MNKDIRSEDYWLEYYGEKEFDFGYEEACDDIAVEIGEDLKSNGISDWHIVNGYVLLPEETYPRNHTWIKFDDDSVIDVCCIEWFGVDSNEIKRVENYYSVFHKDGSEEFFVTNTYSLEEYSKHLKWLHSGKPLEVI
jgi:hypothetical protein